MLRPCEMLLMRGRGEILIQADGDGAEIVELLLTSAAERARL